MFVFYIIIDLKQTKYNLLKYFKIIIIIKYRYLPIHLPVILIFYCIRWPVLYIGQSDFNNKYLKKISEDGWFI